jgi:hypothetical protein
MGLYRTLFQITARHPYFDDEICRDLRWEPSRPTRQAMTNLDLLLRADDTGMTVLYDNHRLEALALLAGQARSDTPGCFSKHMPKIPSS